nr:venom allergen 5-like [Cherax quadricarinatus]XP_053638662.1 venom allergen 5-like [Cherax quadricarinatus]XP_053638663.1 venom allergen 5-like [Cherax quadricarinatus]XP_053638664.1 venom allergen 5-like [Cherax quadricarinatus]XP_053638665.1 venom allergen 5-like [Cherax quadricarinatus]XP_053638667.1 venom allergen 5-like [Cherax quadricarinatus]
MMGTVWWWSAVVMVLMVVVCDSDGRTTQLLKEKEIIQQISLLDRLVDVMLNVTGCAGAKKPIHEKKKHKPKEGVKPTEPSSECDYSQLSLTHTMLKPQEPTCEIYNSEVTEKEKEQILNLHNTLRAQVATGQEKRGAPGPQPPAANMREIVWNDELAQVAQAWASQCPQGHDSARDRRMCTRDYHVGQNIHYYWGFDEGPDWKRAVYEWYDEVADMPSSFVASFQLLKKKKIGHYTQVVWADTSEVGCGIVHYEVELQGKLYPESKIYVCNYGQAGNVKERPIYAEGAAGSQCPGAASSTYPDLCI